MECPLLFCEGYGKKKNRTAKLGLTVRFFFILLVEVSADTSLWSLFKLFRFKFYC